MYKVYRYRVKDKHAKYLGRQARKVNFVWNFCNDAQKHALKWGKKWPNHFDLTYLTSRSSKELDLRGDTISEVCKKYAVSRRGSKRPYLRYRGKKNLGWIPIRGRVTSMTSNGVKIGSRIYSIWLSRHLPSDCRIRDGSNFSQDAKGNWYINLVVEFTAGRTHGDKSVGIDLGLKELAALSNGDKISAPQYFRNYQDKLARAQRAKKKRQAKNIHAKIANLRRDHLHKISTNIVRQHGLIVVGNVNSSALAQTSMAKSVLDAGWSSFKAMLAYKSDCAGALFLEVNESFTTQTCSDCGSISGPKGIAGLGIREWACPCGSIHDRDVNSAKNILRLGCQTLVEGAARLAETSISAAPVTEKVAA